MSASKSPGRSKRARPEPEATTGAQTDASVRPAALLPLPAPALLPSEDVATFEAFQAAFLDDLDPRGAMERYWAADMASLAWEVQRYRRLRMDLIQALGHEGLTMLMPEGEDCEVSLTIRLRHAGLGIHDGGLATRLAELGVTRGQIDAATAVVRLADIDALRLMEEAAEERLHKAMQAFQACRARSEPQPGSTGEGPANDA